MTFRDNYNSTDRDEFYNESNTQQDTGKEKHTQAKRETDRQTDKHRPSDGVSETRRDR